VSDEQKLNPNQVYEETSTGIFSRYGVLTSATYKSGGVSADDKSYYNTADFSWVVGVGFKIPTTPLSIDARYNLGLSNVENTSGTRGTGTIRNGSFQIGLMFKLFSAPVR
jgi:hypothetical protein